MYSYTKEEKKKETYEIVCLTTYMHTLVVSLVYIRMSFEVIRSLLIRSFRRGEKKESNARERERKSNQTLMCGFAA